MMEVTRKPDTETVSVEISLDNTVHLSTAHIKRIVNGKEVNMEPTSPPTLSGARWDGIAAPAGGFTELTLTWTANEPNRPVCPYTATITVTDRGRLEGDNPHGIPSEIGDITPKFGQGLCLIQINP